MASATRPRRAGSNPDRRSVPLFFVVGVRIGTQAAPEREIGRVAEVTLQQWVAGNAGLTVRDGMAEHPPGDRAPRSWCPTRGRRRGPWRRWGALALTSIADDQQDEHTPHDQAQDRVHVAS